MPHADESTPLLSPKGEFDRDGNRRWSASTVLFLLYVSFLSFGGHFAKNSLSTVEPLMLKSWSLSNSVR